MSSQFFCPFFNWVFVFLMLSCISCVYMLDINPLSVILFANIFSHSVGCLFILSMVSFALWKLFSLIRSHLFIFAFISFALGDAILKVYIKALGGFSHVYHPGGLNITLLSEGCMLEMTSAMQMVGRTYSPRRKGWGASNWLGPARRSTGSHALLTEDQHMLEPRRHSFSSWRLSCG